MNLDPFTPWHEEPEALAARTVGREDVLSWLVQACDAWLSGSSEPSWKLLVGSRGAGKSHLLHLARSRLIDPAAVIRVGEDIPVHTDADTLWKAIWEPEDRWGLGGPLAPRHPRPILFLERLDRLVAALRREDRWALRHHLQTSGAFVVATALDASFAASSGEPFYAQLDTWALAPLELDACRELFLRVSGQDPADPAPRLHTRREALIRMTGGNPRAIVTVAQGVGTDLGDAIDVSKGLLLALHRLVTHYQQRFHDLSPLGQQIAHGLAMAPRELTAGEVQELTGATSAAIANAARSLEAAGILHRHPDAADARVSRYALSEPMFRYWLEYRGMCAWEETRVAWVGRLLGDGPTRNEHIDVSEPSFETVLAAGLRLDDSTSEIPEILSRPPRPGPPRPGALRTPLRHVCRPPPLARRARMLARQLREREHGALQPELELVRRALDPMSKRDSTDPS